MNDTCKERIGNRDYVTFRVDTEIPYGLLSTDSNTPPQDIMSPRLSRWMEKVGKWSGLVSMSASI